MSIDDRTGRNSGRSTELTDAERIAEKYRRRAAQSGRSSDRSQTVRPRNEQAPDRVPASARRTERSESVLRSGSSERSSRTERTERTRRTERTVRTENTERTRRADSSAGTRRTSGSRKGSRYPLSMLWTNTGEVLTGRTRFAHNWRAFWGRIFIPVFMILLLVIIAGTVKTTVKKNQEVKVAESQSIAQSEAAVAEAAANFDSHLAEARLLAATYDYDGALEILNSINDGTSQDVTDAIKEIEAQKADLVPVNLEEVTHIFYHSLVIEPEKTYQQTDELVDSYKLWMCTVSEFDKITQKMYDDGYVLVSFYDLVERHEDADGNVTFTEKGLMLPKGKKAYILSLDDLSYYHCYDGRYMASKMIIGDDGKPTCEYIKDDGTTVVGAYDCVPRMDEFLEAHPDGCYKGARGVIALTGYNGILGYRTDIAYKTHERLDDDQAEWLKAHPDFDWDKEREEAQKVAECLKADGWMFASHTWGHQKVDRASLEKIQEDAEKWEKYVKSLVGDTEIIIFAHGFDITDNGAKGYASSDKYAYLKSMGFNIYCDVDSNQYTFQICDGFVHDGRRNLDGYRLYQDAYNGGTRTADLFDAKDIIDPSRHDMPDPE